MVSTTRHHLNQSIITLSFGSLCNDVVHYTYCLDQQLHQTDPTAINLSTTFHINSDKLHIPRLVAVDFKSSLGTLSALNQRNKQLTAVDVDSIHSVTKDFTQQYNNRQIIQTQQFTAKSSSEHVLDDIQLNYNHHNTYTLPASAIDNLTHLTDFNYVTQGLASNNPALNTHIENIIDSTRYWAEQCDIVSGFQIYIDVDSGWAGVACSVIQALQDEFGANVPLVIFGVCKKLDTNHTDYTKHMTRRLINRCVTISTIQEQAALYIPFDGDTLDCSRNSGMQQYDYTVHMFANTIHNITMPYRAQYNPCSLHAYVNHLTPLHKLNVVGVNAMVPVRKDITLLTQRQTRNQQTDQRSAVINNIPFTALWKSNNPDVQVMSPFSQRVERGEQRKASRRNARLVDEDDSDLDSDSDTDMPPTEMLFSELVVCRGLSDEQQMNLTLNYNTLAPSGNREFSYVSQPTQSPHTDKHGFVPAVYDVYNTQLIGRWLQHNSDALAGILGSATVQNLQGSDTVDVRQIIQQFSKDGLTRGDLLEVASSLRSISDAYTDLTG